MQPLIDQLCDNTAITPMLTSGKSRGRSPSFMAEARAKAFEKYSGGTTVIISRTTFAGLRRLFGDKLKSRHLREFLDDLATGQYKITRIKPKLVVHTTATPVVTPQPAGPDWTLHQLAAEFSVPYHIILTRVRQGFIHATRRGKRRLVVSSAEVDRLRTVGIR